MFYGHGVVTDKDFLNDEPFLISIKQPVDTVLDPGDFNCLASALSVAIV